jgi:hypothetical protein
MLSVKQIKLLLKYTSSFFFFLFFFCSYIILLQNSLYFKYIKFIFLGIIFFYLGKKIILLFVGASFGSDFKCMERAFFTWTVSRRFGKPLEGMSFVF